MKICDLRIILFIFLPEDFMKNYNLFFDHEEIPTIVGGSMKEWLMIHMVNFL